MASLYLVDALPESVVGGVITLDGREAHHAAVNRVRAGESLLVGDGHGTLAEVTVESVSSTAIEVRVGSVRTENRPTPEIWLAQALAKGDRDELAIQAATEVGVSGVIPMQTARSVSRWSGPKLEKGVARWESIVREASKQAIRGWVPDVAAPATPGTLVDPRDHVLVLDPRGVIRLADAVASTPTETRRIVLVVGPEGGFAGEEIDRMTAAGAVSVVLGDTVLRTSTAGPAAIAVANVVLERW
ncbi:16S rRNA (uracil(1498)-N(3))-methyltransferase [Labedella phragmitis]|uniref:Ribosomal RNA small subunit methyltransferase E n=1 Tax=Labedella phragmitis TaxID=2498849 RepID=A0A444PVF8_9MICO|nr:16S rRNA (uracil(1498)-N(3))-methyltransferase [Labedella phragmitis]RWZ51848.1 16S rRNA (uracil(1498)-N(3))-methyltransferase [Labedella phragmitis]